MGPGHPPLATRVELGKQKLKLKLRAKTSPRHGADLEMILRTCYVQRSFSTVTWSLAVALELLQVNNKTPSTHDSYQMGKMDALETLSPGR